DLASTDVVVFALTSGNDILDADQKSEFESWVAQGHGFVGIHSATDTEYMWPLYHDLVGATFRNHPPGLYNASVDITDSSNAITATLPNTWTRTDEWYSFTDNPAEAGTLDILLALDESTFAEDPTLSMTPHPISWAHTFEGTRAFYTAMGHPAESYSDPTFVAFLTRAIEWAGAR
ncbi:MAG: ThuA domain-containing protein, partial [Polyangiaceae bacterium]